MSFTLKLEKGVGVVDARSVVAVAALEAAADEPAALGK